MTRQQAKRRLLKGCAAALTVVGMGANAAYVAPPYAGQPNTTSSTWNYNGDWYSGDSASHLSSFTHVDSYQLSTDDKGCGPGVPCLVNNVIGTPLDFYIPNFVDTLPIKRLRIQYQFVKSAQPDPEVLVVGFDPTVGSVVGELLFSTLQTDAFMTNGVFLTWALQDWIIQPNPDFERITLGNVPGSELREVRIDTISIPEPATAFLTVAALFGMALTRRRPCWVPGA